MNYSQIIWVIALLLGVAVVFTAATSSSPELHALLTGVTALILAAIAILDQRKLVSSGAGNTVIAANSAQLMGYVWGWGGLCLLTTYLFVIEWKEWLTFTLIFLGVAGLCLAFAAVLRRDAKSETADDTMTKLGRTLTIVQAVGMVAAMIGLVIDGKIPASKQVSPQWQDWAANNIFFFGALALALLSIYALRVTKTDAKSG